MLRSNIFGLLHRLWPKKGKKACLQLFLYIELILELFAYFLLLNFCVEVVYDNYDQLLLLMGPKMKKIYFFSIFGLLDHAEAIQYTFFI